MVSFPEVGRVSKCQQFQQRGFSGSVAAHKSQKLSLRNLKVHMLQGREVAVEFREAFGLDIPPGITAWAGRRMLSGRRVSWRVRV